VTAAGDARSEDCGSLKYSGLAYIPIDPTTTTILPPITKEQGKTVRGFNHPCTARLLCPRRHLAQFDQDVP
jgi:hypothetical protein